MTSKNRRLKVRLAVFGIAAFVMSYLFGIAGVGCGGTPGVCAPGRVQECPCFGGESGVQPCKNDASGWDA